jgi:hypothetical protein
MAFCEAHGCDRHAIVSLEGWVEATPIPDIALRLRSSKCGNRNIKMVLNVHELYAKAHGVASPKLSSNENAQKGSIGQTQAGKAVGKPCCQYLLAQ